MQPCPRIDSSLSNGVVGVPLGRKVQALHLGMISIWVGYAGAFFLKCAPLVSPAPSGQQSIESFFHGGTRCTCGCITVHVLLP